MIRPLTKCSQEDGHPYKRLASIEEWLEQLDGVAKAARTDQLERGVSESGGEIPPEALVYFARAAWRENDQATFKRLFLALCARVEKLTERAIPVSRLPNAEEAREAVMAKFVDLISEDCKQLHDRLDYFEVRFNSGLLGIRVSVLRKAETARKKHVPTVPLLRRNDETGEEEIPAQMELEAARIAAQDFSRLDDPTFRSAWFAAIDKLPRELRDVVLLRQRGMPIEVADANTMTIVRTLKCTRRTVQNRLTRGVLALRELLKEVCDE